MLLAAGRLTNNERRNTITEELLADPELAQARKRRFNKLQVMQLVHFFGKAYLDFLSLVYTWPVGDQQW